MAQVRDGMTTDVVTIEPSATVVEAAQRMIQEQKGPLPVVEAGRVVAVVTDRDIVARVVAADRDPHSVRVEEVATKDLVTASPDQDVDEARRLMAEHQLDRLSSSKRTITSSGSSRRQISGARRDRWPDHADRRLPRQPHRPGLAPARGDH